MNQLMQQRRKLTNPQRPRFRIEKEYRDITGTVVVIELSTGDLRKEVDELKATLAEQSAAIDTLILGELEG